MDTAAQAGLRPPLANSRLAHRGLDDSHVARLGGSRCIAPRRLATLKFWVRRHECYPQALVLGL